MAGQAPFWGCLFARDRELLGLVEHYHDQEQLHFELLLRGYCRCTPRPPASLAVAARDNASRGRKHKTLTTTLNNCMTTATTIAGISVGLLSRAAANSFKKKRVFEVADDIGHGRRQ